MTPEPPQPFGPPPEGERIPQAAEPILDRPEGQPPEAVEITGIAPPEADADLEPAAEEQPGEPPELRAAVPPQVRRPTWPEVQAKIMQRVPLTEVERQVAASVEVFLPADYPTTASPIEVERIEHDPGPTLYDQLGELTVEERLERLERLQVEQASMFRNIMAELGRTTGREAQLNAIMDGVTPELAVPQL